MSLLPLPLQIHTHTFLSCIVQSILCSLCINVPTDSIYPSPCYRMVAYRLFGAPRTNIVHIGLSLWLSVSALHAPIQLNNSSSSGGSSRSSNATLPITNIVGLRSSCFFLSSSLCVINFFLFFCFFRWIRGGYVNERLVLRLKGILSDGFTYGYGRLDTHTHTAEHSMEYNV